jgi:Ser/Thr protein kinase RdoA (MazF antagonist)
MSDRLDPYLPLARHALQSYALEGGGLDFLQHSDTVTYRVASPKGEQVFLLRLHLPVTAAMGSHGADPDALRSELQWLDALNRETDLTLQRPICTAEGAWVAQLTDRRDGSPVNATLLTWLEGEPYQRELDTEDTARQIGSILAKLHQHAETWAVPLGFSRPRRDLAYFECMLHGLQPLVADGRIQESDYRTLETAVDGLCEMICVEYPPRSRWGVMHADAHKGNLLFHQGQVRLIDFSFCAVGDYLFDLAIVLGDLRPELHPAFLEGYQSLRSLPEGYAARVEGFFIGMMVGFFYYLAGKPATQPILNRKVPQVSREYAARFNRGERFWFTGGD